MTSIKSIRIEGFRSLKSVELRPGRVTVLIGANGVGKSNLLGALRMLHAIQARGLKVFVGTAGGARFLLHYGPKVTSEIDLLVEFAGGDEPFSFHARLGYTVADGLVFLDESVHDGAFLLRESGHAESTTGLADHPTADLPLARVRRALAGIRAFHFHDTSPHAALRGNSRQEDARALHADGGNLAAYLYRLANGTSDAYRAAWERINMLVQRVAPFVRRLQPVLVAPDQAERSAVRLDWVDETGEVFSVHQLSDGTLRAIALFTALGQPIENLPAFITIDEPELGLHPEAIALLAGMIRSISSHSQVLIATQSPQLLDEFPPEDVVVADRNDNQTVLTRLDPAALAIWIDRYSLSEIWSKNLIGGTP